MPVSDADFEQALAVSENALKISEKLIDQNRKLAEQLKESRGLANTVAIAWSDHFGAIAPLMQTAAAIANTIKFGGTLPDDLVARIETQLYEAEKAGYVATDQITVACMTIAENDLEKNDDT